MAPVHAISGLQKTYVSAQGLLTPLNTPFREALRKFAASQSFQFSEDSAGNNYITRPGKDPELAPIAIAFPLDGGLSEYSFASASRIFLLLSKEDLSCGLILLGWTSLGSRIIGREIWEASASKSPYDMPPELGTFVEMDDPKNVSLSAIVEVSEQREGVLRAKGSPILIEKARKFTKGEENISEPEVKLTRAPFVSIIGPAAESIACSLIREYSGYITALFDNFD
ncbi:hypothetical protein F4779DRAFT_514900 [Xylariaceae sp. FL0662B]|nr:hypothetical protein F4779DRAFT_514900 [Xylariaceae sp. FL0662B]